MMLLCYVHLSLLLPTFVVFEETFQLSPVDKVVLVSEDVLLVCSPPDSYPTPTVSWLKDGVTVDGDRFTVQSNGSLLITGAEFSDEGSYSCVATNEYLNITRTSASASLLVYRKLTLQILSLVEIHF